MSGVTSNTTRRIRKGSTLPATCTPGEVFIKESGGSEGVYACITTANTWVLLDINAGDGTVTSVSVVSANGLAGSVANPTTTPAITLSTSITGVLKGNGTAISAAGAGTDYLAPTGDGSGLTGLTKSQIGLGNVDNTSDATKNSAVATLTNKTLTSPVINTPTGIVKGDVGLGNVDNTSDATKDAAVTTLTNKTISGAANTLTVDGTNAVGFRTIPQNSQADNYTLVLTDSGKHILETGATKTITIPANASVAFPIGTAITFIVTNASGVTIAITTDTLRWADGGTTGSRTLAQYGVATAIKIDATNWLISGTGLS